MISSRFPAVTNEHYIVPEQIKTVEKDRIRATALFIKGHRKKILLGGLVATYVGLCSSRFKSQTQDFLHEHKSAIDLFLKIVPFVYGGISLIPEKNIDLQDSKRDLTLKALEKQIPDIQGRESVLQEVISVLFAQNKPNVLLIGEPGVGKTALVEGLAHYLISKDVPEALKGMKLLEVKASEFVSGASFFGSMESRIETFIKQLESQDFKNTIVFIDEAHMLMDSKGTTSTKDMLKPMLARGVAKFICATTNKESKQIMEDGALARRFHTIEITRPSNQSLLNMAYLRAQDLANHHRVIYSKKAIRHAVEKSASIPGVQPDKTITLLDLAGAKVKLEPSQVRALGVDPREEHWIPNSYLVTESTINTVAARQVNQLVEERKKTHYLT